MGRTNLIKSLAGVVVLAILFVLVANWVGDYRQATNADGGGSSTEATKSADGEEPTTTASAPDGAQQPVQVLVVAVDGLNFRAEPDGQSKALRGLSKGEKVTLLSTEGDWFKVRDSNKVVGYITSNPTYTDVAK